MSQEAYLLLGAILNALASWGAIKITLSWHRADIDRAQKTADNAHQRIDGIIRNN